MDHSEGAGSLRADLVEVDHRVQVDFQAAPISADDGLLLMFELDDTLWLSDLAAIALLDRRRGTNTGCRLDCSRHSGQKCLPASVSGDADVRRYTSLDRW